MSKFKIKIIDKKDIWESFILNNNPQSFLQSWNWGETNALLGKKIFRLGIYDKNKLIGVCLVIKEDAKRGSHFLIPGGPVINWNNKYLVKVILDYLINLARLEMVWFIRIRPEITNTENIRIYFNKLGFISAPMHLHAENTWVLDITHNENELLAGMRKNTRYLVRKSLNAGLSMIISKDPKDVSILKKLQDITVKRHKFIGFSEELFKNQMLTFGKDNQADLFICKLGKSYLSAAIVIYYGDYAYYHHSASDERAREIPASYYMQWKIISEAKKNGKKYYNFWGISPTDDPKHRFAGVTLFKKGFGGKRIDWLHAQDYPISNYYWLTYIFETFRRLTRHL